MKRTLLALVLLISPVVSAVEAHSNEQSADGYGNRVRSGSHPRCGLGLHNKYSNRIIGGRDAKKGEFPFEVALAVRRRNASEPSSCSAFIIDEWHLLTAAHCIADPKKGSPIDLTMAVMGSSTLLDPSMQMREVVRGYVHQGWLDTHLVDDIALLKVAAPIEFNLELGRKGGVVAPICLPSSRDDGVKVGEIITAVGWGMVTNVTNITETLQTGDFRTVDDDRFSYAFSVDASMSPDEQQQMREALKLWERRAGDHFIIDRLDGPNSTLCNGDSGGPAVRRLPDGRYQAVGIASLKGNTSKEGCSPEEPAAYTELAHYLDWIESAKRILADYVQGGVGPFNKFEAPDNVARPGDLPFSAYINTFWRNSRNRLKATGCNGAIIDNWYVLTSGHCLKRCKLEVDEVRVSVGANKLYSIYEGQLRLGVSGYAVHPDYDPCNNDTINDVAVVKLERRIEFGLRPGGFGSINRVSWNRNLSELTKNNRDRRVVVSGWPQWHLSPLEDDRKRAHSKQVLSGLECGLPIPGTVVEVCIVDDPRDDCKSINHGNKDSYPAVLMRDGRYHLIGFSSRTKHNVCSVSRYWSLDYYRDWIKQAIEKLEKPEESPLVCGKNAHYTNMYNRATREGIAGEFPHLVLLRTRVRDEAGATFSFSCAGSLIDRSHILTAASCVEHCKGKTFSVFASPVYSPLGLRDQREVSRGYSHQHYRACEDQGAEFMPGNLAVLQLDQPVKFQLTASGNGSINSICPPQWGFDVNPGDELLVARWDISEDQAVDELGLVFVSRNRVTDRRECQEAWSRWLQREVTIGDDQFCLTAADEDEEISCAKDVGTPAMKYVDGQLHIVGFKASTSFSCRQKGPNLYTRVASHLTWIDKFTISPHTTVH